jgi:hypothetical protein
MNLGDDKIPADAMIGLPGRLIANASLSHERTIAAAFVVRLRLGVHALAALARNVAVDGRPAIDSDRLGDRIEQFIGEVEALAAFTYANVTRLDRGTERPHGAAMVSRTQPGNRALQRRSPRRGERARRRRSRSARWRTLARRMALRAALYDWRRQLRDHANTDR